MDLVNETFRSILVALGISTAPNEYVGGLFLAVCLGVLVNSNLDDAERMRMTNVVLISSLLGTVAAVAGKTVAPAWPIQLVMAVSGGFALLGLRMILKNRSIIFQSILEKITGKQVKK